MRAKQPLTRPPSALTSHLAPVEDLIISSVVLGLRHRVATLQTYAPGRLCANL